MQARRIEEKADKIAIDARNEIAGSTPTLRSSALVNSVEEAIDELEQAAFISSLAQARLLRKCLGRWPSFVRRPSQVRKPLPPALLPPPMCPTGTESIPRTRSRRLVGSSTPSTMPMPPSAPLTAIVLRGEFDLKTALSVLELAVLLNGRPTGWQASDMCCTGTCSQICHLTGNQVKMHIVRIGDGFYQAALR